MNAPQTYGFAGHYELFSKCIAIFSSSFGCKCICRRKQGISWRNRTYQHTTGTAVHIYEAFAAYCRSNQSFGGAFHGKIKIYE